MTLQKALEKTGTAIRKSGGIKYYVQQEEKDEPWTRTGYLVAPSGFTRRFCCCNWDEIENKRDFKPVCIT